MFEVGFFELAVIFGVALVVLGPTRLPGLVRKVGRWVGKARSMARQFREQLENEVNLDELNKITESPREQKFSTPAPPPEFSGESLANSGYPYGAQTPVAAEPQIATTAITDDTYSHAHEFGTEPMPYNPDAQIDAFAATASDAPADAAVGDVPADKPA